jgi:hypothetical protein
MYMVVMKSYDIHLLDSSKGGETMPDFAIDPVQWGENHCFYSSWKIGTKLVRG